MVTSFYLKSIERIMSDTGKLAFDAANLREMLNGIDRGAYEVFRDFLQPDIDERIEEIVLDIADDAMDVFIYGDCCGQSDFNYTPMREILFNLFILFIKSEYEVK